MLKFNRLIPLFLALFLPAAALAQGVVIAPQTALKTVNGTTSVIPGATITVCAANTSGLPCSPALVNATFTNPALTQPLANPFTADANGNYNFAIATGTYTVTVTASGFTGYSYQLSAPCLPASCAGIGKQMSVQTFTANGTFTIPAGVTSAKVTVVGGGGAGGGSTAANNGGGGGAGGVGIKWLSGLTPGNTLIVAIGAGGAGISGVTGNPGTGSSVSSGTQVITTITALGGLAGLTGTVGAGGPSVGPGTGGDLNLGGSPGGNGISGAGGNGASSILQGGGASAIAAIGNNALAFGSGGGGSGSNGAGNLAGGFGSAGIVIFEWVN